MNLKEYREGDYIYTADYDKVVPEEVVRHWLRPHHGVGYRKDGITTITALCESDNGRVEPCHGIMAWGKQ